MKKMGFIPVIIGSLYLLTACQKSVSERREDPEEPPPGEGWMMVWKEFRNFDTVVGLPINVKAGYFYDTVARTIIYRDTSMYGGIADAFGRETIHTYDAKARIINVKRSGAGILPFEATLNYGADDRLQSVQEQSNISFTWTQQGSEWVGQSSDGNANGGPYSAGNKIYTLNSDGKLMVKVHLSTDTAFGNSYDEVVRNANGNVVQRKLYEKKNDVIDQYDSVVYERDESSAPRLSRFYETLGKGIEWYSGNTAIRFLDAPSFYSEYFEFENSLCNKIIYFSTNKNAGGQWVTTKYGEREFQSVYDSDGNLVKQTVLDDGIKLYELTYRWARIKWLN